MLKIIILDNYRILRFGMSNLLKTHFKDVSIQELASMDEIPQSKERLIADIIILGINDNTEKTDLNIFSTLKSIYPSTPIIIYDEILYNFKTLPYIQLGIEGYLLKQDNPTNLLRAIETVLMGKRYVCKSVLTNLFNTYLLGTSSAERKQLLIDFRSTFNDNPAKNELS